MGRPDRHRCTVTVPGRLRDVGVLQPGADQGANGYVEGEEVAGRRLVVHVGPGDALAEIPQEPVVEDRIPSTPDQEDRSGERGERSGRRGQRRRRRVARKDRNVRHEVTDGLPSPGRAVGGKQGGPVRSLGHGGRARHEGGRAATRKVDKPAS